MKDKNKTNEKEKPKILNECKLIINDEINRKKIIDYGKIPKLSHNKINDSLKNMNIKHNEIKKMSFHEKKQMLNKLTNNKYVRLFNIPQ